MATEEAALGTIITNIGTLVTFEPLVREKRYHSITEKDLGIKQGAWIAFNEKILASGTGTPPDDYASFKTIDAQGGLVLPGLVDCHTHPIFAGSRANEFAMRLNGSTYQEIAAKGGGIKATVAATRAASDQELKKLTLQRLKTFLSHGVTTVEVKSGYGLGVEEELRLLRILKQCQKDTPQRLSVTCLALHAMPPGETDVAHYVERCTNELLPQVKAENLAESVDAFVEDGYFSVKDVTPYLRKAKDLGLNIRIHADEFSDSGAASLAAEFGAVSADHLQFASPQGIDSLAKADVTAVLLPGTSLYTDIPYADGKRLASAQCKIAIATDYNPGSCRFDNLSFIASLAAVHCKLTAAQTLGGVCIAAANSLKREGFAGQLAPAANADLLICNYSTYQDWLASFGCKKPRTIVVGGQIVTHEN